MADKLSNEAILEQLRNGMAKFELVSSPLPSISAASPNWKTSFFGNNSNRFFASIGHSFASIGHSFASISHSFGARSPCVEKVDSFTLLKVKGDETCLFRALVKGMAYNEGATLYQREEKEEADELRLAVSDVICENKEEHYLYEDALTAISAEECLQRYCNRISRPGFWGGESELMVISKLCKQPIIVYRPDHEDRVGGWGSQFIPIAEYGTDFEKPFIHYITEYGSDFEKESKPKKVVRLLYSGKNHYDLLIF